MSSRPKSDVVGAHVADKVEATASQEGKRVHLDIGSGRHLGGASPAKKSRVVSHGSDCHVMDHS